MTIKTHGPRSNRGLGNGKGDAWYNSPLWDNIEKKKRERREKDKDIKVG